jgi:GNAT superfamily N-acetyltransferase
VPIEVRPVETRADREQSLAIFNTVFPRRAISLADVLDWEDAARASLTLLAGAVGSAHVGVEDASQHPAGAIYVLAEHRNRGAGSALYAAVSGWARELGFDRLRGSVEADDEESLAWATRRGFVEHSRDSRLVLELGSIEAPRVEAPEGVEIVTWAERPELARGLYDVYREAEPDIPGEEEHPLPGFEDWLREDMSGSGDRPEWTFVAVAGDEVVGYAKFSMTAARPDIAFHDLTGVKRAWRGRGIARALKATQIAWAKEHGYARLETSNEERNAPIRRLNADFGYRLAPGRVTLVGPLAP